MRALRAQGRFAYCGLLVGWVFVRAWAALRFARFRLAHPTHPLRGGAGWGLKTERPSPPARALPSESAGVAWVPALAGRVGVRGGRVGGVFSPRPGTGGNQEPAGRSSGGGLSVLIPASRRWTSRQNPDRASPA